MQTDKLRVKLTLLSGSNLSAQDKNGLSDPYVALDIGGMQQCSKVVKRSLNPVWDESFEWVAAASEIRDASLQLEVFDRDGLGLSDDPLGAAAVSLGHYADKEGESQELQLKLSTQGQLRVRLELGVAAPDAIMTRNEFSLGKSLWQLGASKSREPRGDQP